MKRLMLVFISFLTLLPSTSRAIQLHWSTGADTLSFASAHRCVLVVRADSAESALPNEWRLAWLADSVGANFVPMDSLYSCDVDTAKVSAIDLPATPSDSVAHMLSAHFCSAGAPQATVAYFVLDQPGGSCGRLKVFALDPTDPDQERVIASNEVTYNGGVSGNYAPVLLRASSTHATALLRVKVIGAELDSINFMKLGAADDLWHVDLSITTRDTASIEATGDVPSALPEGIVQAFTDSGTSACAVLASELYLTASAASAGADTILYRDPNPSIYPKDFAFYYNAVPNISDPLHPWKGVYHLFYIRNKAGQDSIIAHAWTDSLGKAWTLDSLAFRPSGHNWDGKKVWAPSIQAVGNLTYMFYTGVDSVGNQSVGYATTTVLGTTNITWSRSTTPVYQAKNTSWADSIGHQVFNVVQFRDPFIMPDPDVTNYPGQYLMYIAGEDRALHPHYTVGVARNVPGTLRSWRDLGNYPATDYTHLAVSGALESPIVVRDSLTGAWRLFVANADYDANGYFSTIFETQTVGDSLTDRRASEWPQRDSLYRYVGNDADVIGWQACEHLQIGRVHFFAAYDGTGIGITRMHWDPVAHKFIFVHPDVTGVAAGTPGNGIHLSLVGLRPAAGVIRFAMESPGTIVPKLTVYDVGGRRVRKLMEGRSMQGRSEVTWDCRDESGQTVATGMYFARMTAAGNAQVLRVPIVR